ncbi:hypothetical protein [Mycobacterium leprae]|uniref:hypothetical protein n=1 Tax=Mycobacterium leprae TaxID=1769 RepID=UPI001E64021F|nr:hypothetical protein [Mycobacterium leprae]
MTCAVVLQQRGPTGEGRSIFALASTVDHVECVHELEAGVGELRVPAAHARSYNRESRPPQQ